MPFETINPLTGRPESWGGREHSVPAVNTLPKRYEISDDPQMRELHRNYKNPAIFAPEKYKLSEYDILTALGVDPRRALDEADAYADPQQDASIVWDDIEQVFVQDGYQRHEDVLWSEFGYVYTVHVDKGWEEDGYALYVNTDDDHMGYVISADDYLGG